MNAIRHLLAQRHFAAVICAAALLLKLIVPTGYMVADQRGAITIAICSGDGAARTMTMILPGADGAQDHEPSDHHGKAQVPCAYAGLSAQLIGAAVPAMLAAAIAVAAAPALSAVSRLAVLPAPHLRPPLRGPPLH